MRQRLKWMCRGGRRSIQHGAGTEALEDSVDVVPTKLGALCRCACGRLTAEERPAVA
jgi:hypothetical protein